MAATSELRGHPIECIKGEWFYSNTKLPTAENWESTPCGHCGERATREGHDSCLGTLHGVMNACCGHGNVEAAYIQFPNGEVVSGRLATQIAEDIKNAEGLR